MARSDKLHPGAPLTLGWAALPLLLSACAGAQRVPAETLPPGELERFNGPRAAEQLGIEGWIVVRELRGELGGGEELEAVVVEGRLLQGPEPEELRVSTWRPTESGWELVARSEPVPGNAVELFLLEPCGGATALLFAAVEEEPDQRRHRLFVLEDLPRLRKALGVQRDVEATLDSGFDAAPEGFVFRAGEAEERWRCVAGRFEAAAPVVDQAGSSPEPAPLPSSPEEG